MEGSLEIIGDVILLQELLLGVFSTGGLIFALLLLFGKLQWAREKFGTLCKVSPQALIVGGLLTLFPAYFLGITTNRLARIWIDKPSVWHLGLKGWWNEYDDDDRTDDRIKCEMYSRAFECGKNLCKDESNIKTVREWYFQVYSPIILEKENKEFRDYIHYSQKRVNLARLWAFISFVILVVCLFNLGRAGWYKLWPPTKFSESLGKSDLCTVLVVAVVAVMIYCVSVNVWVGAEKNTRAKFTLV